MSDGWIERKPTPSEELGRMDEAVRSLTEQLAAETKRREGIEDELYEERLAHTAAVTRADQAERERDNVQRSAAHWKEAKERAEADNAALLALLSPDDGEPDTDEAAEEWSRRVLDVLEQPHPGAALLERMRALETLASAVREYLSPTFPSTVGDLLPVRDALAALDALKVPRE